MKTVMILVPFIFINFNLKSQVNLNKVCSICDSIAKRNCGDYLQIINKKIERKKFNSDLKAIASLEDYLLDSLSSGLNSDSSYKIVDYTNKDNPLKEIYKRVVLNFFDIHLIEFANQGKYYKYAGIVNKRTAFCGLDSQMNLSNIFDKRLIKLLVKKLRINYAFLSCSTIYLNYFGTLSLTKQQIKPIKIQKSIIDPNKYIWDILK